MTKAELRQIRFLDMEINCLLKERERISKLVPSLRSPLITGVGRGTDISDPTAETVLRFLERLEDLDIKINSRIDELYSLKERAISEINVLSDERYRAILLMRYIEGRSWEEIARDLHYSLRMVYYLHGSALSAINS